MENLKPKSPLEMAGIERQVGDKRAKAASQARWRWMDCTQKVWVSKDQPRHLGKVKFCINGNAIAY